MDHYNLAPANYGDYREFLKARFDEIKRQNVRFSLQACASRAKISKSLLQFVFKKKRHVGLDKVPDLAKSLKLTSDEEYFVCLMICKGASKNPEIQSHFERILDRLRHRYITVEKSEPTTSESDDQRLYQNPLMMNLQTLVRLPDFKEDLDWIRSTLQIPNLKNEEIRAALNKLEQLNFVRRDQQGKLIAPPESLWRPDPYDLTGESVYIASARSISNLIGKGAYRPSVYMSMSLAMDEQNLLKAEKFMIEVHHKLTELSKNSKVPTAVAFVGNFFLTVARLKP